MTFRLRGFAAAPLAGRIVMGSCCHQWTMLKLRACASAALEFERYAFFCAAALLDFRISSQQSDAHIS